MQNEDLAAMVAVLLVNTKAGQALRKGTRLNSRDLLGRGPALSFHPEAATDQRQTRRDLMDQAKAREARILARHKEARSKAKKR